MLKRPNGNLYLMMELRLYQDNADSNSLTIQEAKSWFAKAQQKESTYARHGQQKDKLLSGKFSPWWKQIKHWELSGKKRILEIPIIPKQKLSVKIKSNAISNQVRGSQKTFHPTHNFARLVMIKDSIEKIHAAIMEIIGLDSYLKDEQYDLEGNNFLKTDSDFTGVVLFKSFPQGEFIRGYRYVNGIRSGLVYEGQTTSSSGLSRSKASCVIIIEHDRMDCVPSSDGGANCTLYRSYTTLSIPSCGETGGGIGSSEGSGGGLGGGESVPNRGGSGGGGIPPDYPEGGNEDLKTLLSLQAIEDSLRNEPFALLPDTIPCSTIKKWLNLASFVPDSTIINKLHHVVNLTSGSGGVGMPGFTEKEIAHVQNINDAYSKVVNMDYFPVKVSKLPVVNGKRLSASEFLTYIRRNINRFVKTKYTVFSPYKQYEINDRSLWNSSNPKGAILTIDMWGPDNGSVVTSYSSFNRWLFTTIYEPKYDHHPVSGNREFGYTQNKDGSYTFYTRGVDRIQNAIETIGQNWGNAVFGITDPLWSSLQDSICTFVKDHSGLASLIQFHNIGEDGNDVVQPYEFYRPNWGMVEKVLNGKLEISILSKGCLTK